MTYQLRLHPQVESDIEDAALWYEKRQAGLGGAFVHEVRQAIDALKSNPLLLSRSPPTSSHSLGVSQAIPISDRFRG